MTPTEVQTLVTAVVGLVAAISAYLAYQTKQQVAVVEKNTNSTNATLTAKVEELHAALLVKAETSPALPPATTISPTLPGWPQH
jgi:hypothetical protein